jgi:membrane associated rhomboid family serine protease
LKRRGLETSFVPFAELTHVEATAWGAWLATRRTTLVIRRRQFVRERDADALIQAVLEGLADEPGGEQQLARIRDVAQHAQRPQPRRATSALVALCLGVFALQFWDPFATQVALFIPDLVSAGEWWRITTANLLHDLALIPVHLIINMLCLLAFGLMVERPLGAIRTFLVMAVGGLGAMAGCAVAGYNQVLGASGVVAGLVGGAVWLEFNESERLPAWWRIPRRLFVAVLLLQGALDLVLPFIAAAAHFGGLLAGYAVMPFAARGALEREQPNREQRYVAAALALVVLASLVSAGQLIRREPYALANHGRHLMTLQNVHPQALNELAWRMVTESEPDSGALVVAGQLAERAVEKTRRQDPNVLDTLAEVLFLAGDDQAAVAVIDEAIFLAGTEVYFREQRRRFTGERAADDRPDPPTSWILPEVSPDEVFPLQDPGISI